MSTSQTQPVPFTKMHGLGNDFVIINTLESPIHLSEQTITQLANRHTGIGFDQLLLIETSEHADFFCRIFNADGSEAEQCGNGLRCVARFLHETGLCQSPSFTLATHAGVFPIAIKDYEHICVTMGIPRIQQKPLTLQLASTDTTFTTRLLAIGNPHAIIKIGSLDTVSVPQLGAEIAQHATFSEGVNVGFMEIINPHHIKLRTFERGAGQTYACGSNACAAACTGIINGWLSQPVQVEFQCGILLIEWGGESTPVRMTGPATHVFSGHLSNQLNDGY